MLFSVSGFHGENRALHPMLLPNDVGQYSRNQKPGRGDLRPWAAPLSVATAPSGAATIYRMGRDNPVDGSYWLSWPSVVHAVRGYDTSDTTERTYYSGDSYPKVTNNVFGLASAPYPTTSRPLGIPAPVSACTLSATGGSSTTTGIYYYVYTYVSDWGWESAPSPLSLQLTRKLDDTTTITSFATAPSGNYNINRIRIYRTQAGSSGTADFFFVKEITYGTTTTTEASTVILGETLPTASWVPAPGVPQGGSGGLTESPITFLTPLWNGMLAGICDNSVRICEPYTPYAWPEAYAYIPPDSKPVGIGAFGQAMLILTTGKPVLMQGSTPEAMDQQKLEIQQSCIAPRSIVSMGTGICWASPDGLCYYNGQGVKVLTEGLMLRTDWQALVPSTIVGRMHEGRYFASYNDGSGLKGFIIDPEEPKGLLFLDTGYDVSHYDELNDQLYVYSGTTIYKWDAGSPMTFDYKSKTFKMPKPTPSFGCCEVLSDSYPVTFKLYCDDVLKHTQTVTDNNPFRLPSGFMVQKFYIELSGTSNVIVVNIAHSPEELATA